MCLIILRCRQWPTLLLSTLDYLLFDFLHVLGGCTESLQSLIVALVYEPKSLTQFIILKIEAVYLFFGSTFTVQCPLHVSFILSDPLLKLKRRRLVASILLVNFIELTDVFL